MTEPSSLPAEATSETDEQYLLWGCERAKHLLDQEEARRIVIERKAAASTGITLALASFYAKDVAASAVSLRAPTAWFAAPALLFAVCMLFYTYRTVSVAGHKSVNPDLLCDDGVSLQAPAVSYLGYLRHLRDTLNGLRVQLDAKAELASKAQQWALFSSVLFVVAFLVHAFTS